MLGVENFSKSKVFFIGCIAFVVGVALMANLSFLLSVKKSYWLILVILCLFCLLIVWRKKFARNAFVWLAFLFLAFFRYSFSVLESSDNFVNGYNNKNITFSGVVLKEPDVSERNRKLTINEIVIKKINSNEVEIAVEGRVLVGASLYPKYGYGDKLQIECTLRQPKEFNGFQYDRYLAKLKIYSLCDYPNIKLIKKDKGNKIYAFIYAFKEILKKKINMNLLEPEAGLARAIILGDKRGITADLRDSFSRSGISHVVAISGMHIGIISTLLMVCLIYVGLKRQMAFWVSFVFLMSYILMIGAPASAVRAGFMGLLVLIALNIGRLNKITNALVISAFILLLINPLLLRDDIGFQLSFLAVGGIIFFYPIFSKLVDCLRSSDFFKKVLPSLLSSTLVVVLKIVSVTICAQILIFPIIVINFKVLSLVAPLTNVLVLWLLPILMILIILALIVSFLNPVVAWLFFLLIELMLKYIVNVSNLLIEIPYAYLEISYVRWYWYLFYYLGLIYILCLNYWHEKKDKNKSGCVYYFDD